MCFSEIFALTFVIISFFIIIQNAITMINFNDEITQLLLAEF